MRQPQETSINDVIASCSASSLRRIHCSYITSVQMVEEVSSTGRKPRHHYIWPLALGASKGSRSCSWRFNNRILIIRAGFLGLSAVNIFVIIARPGFRRGHPLGTGHPPSAGIPNKIFRYSRSILELWLPHICKITVPEILHDKDSVRFGLIA